MWSRKAKIQPQMAVSGNADIFSIKVDSRLKTILFPTGVATEMNFNSVLFEKFTSSPKCRLRECSWRVTHKMPDPNFKGCFGLIWHFMSHSPTTLP